MLLLYAGFSPLFPPPAYSTAEAKKEKNKRVQGASNPLKARAIIKARCFIAL